MHPHRIFTKGRQVATGMDISLGQRTVAKSGFAGDGSGWNYGINAQALIGNAYLAAEAVLERAHTPAAKGYEFRSFSLISMNYL